VLLNASKLLISGLDVCNEEGNRLLKELKSRICLTTDRRINECVLLARAESTTWVLLCVYNAFTFVCAC
jgi:hypothetical protein